MLQLSDNWSQTTGVQYVKDKETERSVAETDELVRPYHGRCSTQDLYCKMIIQRMEKVTKHTIAKELGGI